MSYKPSARAGTDGDTVQAPWPVAPLQQALLHWYDSQARDLPWRRTNDPYHIWLSEVMLQQTQVATATGYYERFVEHFPTLADLAAASADDVLELWAGLGYYRRARNFHLAVREVAATYEGEVPATYEQFRSLPGVGPYTAGAVLSIAFGKPVPAVDGNVLRVISRLAGIGEPIDRVAGRRPVEQLAQLLVHDERPGDWNQALMELGALVCRPQGAQCEQCPLQTWCVAYDTGAVEALPVVAARQKVRPVQRLVAAVWVGDRLIFCRRPSEGLLAGMWDLPAVKGEPDSWGAPGEKEEVLKAYLEASGFRDVRLVQKHGGVSHQFSHVKWDMTVYEANASGAPAGDGWLSVPFGEVSDMALARGTEKAVALAMPFGET